MNEEFAARREAHLIETDALEAHLKTGAAATRLIDMRGYVRTETAPDGTQTAQYMGAREEYAAGHLPGAVYLDWTRDIVDEDDPVAAQVAPPEKLARVLGAAGIGNRTPVVVYDNHPASQFATRLWWVLRYAGHTDVRVLNGGWAKWTREGRPVTTEIPVVAPAEFTPQMQTALRAQAEDVLHGIGSPNVTLLDARDEGQYTGRIRRGSRGGHIPSARNLAREAFFTAEGTFKSPEELQQIAEAQGVVPDKQVVAYCNGGVAATSVLFALSMLGFPRLTNYDGSWNEWAERSDLPTER